MQLLATYKAALLAVPDVATKLKGGIMVGRVDQNALRPNILLEVPEQGGDYSHNGPVGLYDAHLKVTCRSEVDATAIALGDAVVLALQNWRGTLKGCAVQMTEHFNTAFIFDEGNSVFCHVSEYTSFYSRI